MKKQRNRVGKLQRSPCPVAGTLDIIGDKWSLLVVRDLFAGKQTYSEFQGSPEKIPSNILAERLKRLLEHGIVEKVPYQTRPPRYRYVLTPKGRELGLVLKAMVTWGEKHIPGSKAMIKPLNDFAD